MKGSDGEEGEEGEEGKDGTHPRHTVTHTRTNLPARGLHVRRVTRVLRQIYGKRVHYRELRHSDPTTRLNIH